ncbi:type II toxin-antitoxin system RelE/ParE family toxin [Acidithiobacillus caldus]|uniref:Addiction module toxin RelE n=1 Tax=Acidithiobacillus caldus TaxID=33059 RepID=A0A1E7YKI4_9PROT|nr:type II toxin-antitoxin system RelE/ParE family toxin [Acidithiobacillus caldus]OFC30237.1 addiction module toxin RelE [Acidithiobacillus caldus]OFC30635.1 addiction module toxin RelE [Acidithiobacillus caldus]OFC36199.1 addiction module toxin RelE [Acidithiobacillus caldus]
MNVLWTPEARADRDAIWNTVAEDSPKTAARLDGLFHDAARRLELFPDSGRPASTPGTRELIPHKHYRLVYEIHENVVWILALVHTSRLWPPVLPHPE